MNNKVYELLTGIAMYFILIFQYFYFVPSPYNLWVVVLGVLVGSLSFFKSRRRLVDSLLSKTSTQLKVFFVMLGVILLLYEYTKFDVTHHLLALLATAVMVIYTYDIIFDYDKK